jgi:hypothetical protein
MAPFRADVMRAIEARIQRIEQATLPARTGSTGTRRR